MASRQSRLLKALLATIFALTGASCIGAPAKDQSGSPASKPVAVATTTSTAPTTDRTLDGAKAAATAYLRLAEAIVFLDDAEAAKLQREASSKAAADGLVAELHRRLDVLRRSFPEGTPAFRVAPLAVRAAWRGADRVDTEIWYVGVVVPRQSVAYEEWRTSRYQFVWERGAWRIEAESSEPGPRPSSQAQPVPVSGPALAALLARFEAPR